jgi:hypothetical protein
MYARLENRETLCSYLSLARDLVIEALFELHFVSDDLEHNASQPHLGFDVYWPKVTCNHAMLVNKRLRRAVCKARDTGGMKTSKNSLDANR